MLTQEKYDKIIESIEKQVEERPKDYYASPLDGNEVGQTAFSDGECSYIDNRSKNEIFKFLTGFTLSQYLNYRVMMFAYKTLLEQSSFNLDPIINIVGVSNLPALYKKFKEVFHMTPKEAYERQITSLYIEPMTWQTLSPVGREMFDSSIDIDNQKAAETPKPTKKVLFGLVVATGILIISGLFFYYSKIVQAWNGVHSIYACAMTGDTDNPQWSSFGFIPNDQLNVDTHNKSGNITISTPATGYRESIIIQKITPQKIIFFLQSNPSELICMKKDSDGIAKANFIGVDSERIFLTCMREEVRSELESQWGGIYNMYYRDYTDFGDKKNTPYLYPLDMFCTISLETASCTIGQTDYYDTIIDFDKNTLRTGLIFDNAIETFHSHGDRVVSSEMNELYIEMNKVIDNEDCQ